MDNNIKKGWIMNSKASEIKLGFRVLRGLFTGNGLFLALTLFKNYRNFAFIDYFFVVGGLIISIILVVFIHFKIKKLKAQ